MLAQNNENPLRGVTAFNDDIVVNRGYRYTTNASLSSLLANRRLTDAALAAVDLRGKKVIDIGCGDGAYTFELFDRGAPASMQGVDLAGDAVKVARDNCRGRPIDFRIESADRLSFAANTFDIAHVRGVLHHMDVPRRVLSEALRVAPTVIVLEPNGYNPALKVLEWFSPYHRQHRERSYTSVTLDRWIGTLGARVRSRSFVGLVPFFCPDPAARILKRVEPYIEKIPFLRTVGCAVYVVVYTR